MALLGRESQAERDRVERIGAWIRARSGLAVVSVPIGVVAVIDFFTLVLGVGLGVLAIVLGVLGLRELRRRPHLLGRRMAIAGIVLGCTAQALSTLFYVLVVRSGR
jgi:hypothetical protein